MRYVVCSDLHGNLSALEQMLMQTKTQHIDRYLFCGDIFGYFYQQKEIIRLLREERFLCIMGNHDAMYLDALTDVDKRQRLVERYGSSYLLELGEQELAWLRALPKKRCIEEENARLLMVHGSVNDHLDGRIYPDTPLGEQTAVQADYLLFGHTHYRLLRNVDGMTYLNAGSLGQPRDGQGCSYAILDTMWKSVDFFKVNVDKESLTEAVQQERNSTTNRDYLLRKIEEM